MLMSASLFMLRPTPRGKLVKAAMASAPAAFVVIVAALALCGPQGVQAQTQSQAQPEPVGSAQAQAVRIVLPAHINAACVSTAAQDYGVRADVLLAMVQVESRGKSISARNTNGTVDCGVAQQNYGGNGWGTHLEQRYGITCQDMLASPCQSIRAQAYVLRREMDSAACRAQDVWCAVARYHSPGNAVLQQAYVNKVAVALNELHRTGRFAKGGGQGTTAPSSASYPSAQSAPSTQTPARQPQGFARVVGAVAQDEQDARAPADAAAATSASN